MPEGAHPPVQTIGTAPLATGGPDDFGYTWDDSVSFNWIDATNGTDTGMSGYGQKVGPIPLPFPFKFYENTYTQVHIAASGYLAFTDEGTWPGQSRIPSPSKPNNVVAPYWTPIYIDTGSWVRYLSGGNAPNRYFVVEWHDVKGGPPSDSIGQDETYRFEVILHENGGIVFQYHTMTYTGSWWCGQAGIEDSTGLDGLAYGSFCQQHAQNKAVRFYRPAPAARVSITPLYQGRFARAGAMETFQVSVRNTGELGSDTYDLFLSSTWPVSLYRVDGMTPLTDTDGDGAVDTGSVAQASAVTITAGITPPAGAAIGDHNTVTATVRSSRDVTRSKTFTLQTAIPAPFAQVFRDNADGAMSLYLARPNRGPLLRKASPDRYYGYDMAVAETAGSNFIYVWSKGRCLDANCNLYGYEIEYTLVGSCGPALRGVSKLTDHSGATMSTDDYAPAVAVAPNGRIGVLWYRYLWNRSTSQFNYNIWFAILDATGALAYGPVNVTNNTTWGTWSDLNVLRFYQPRIAATTDNRFVLSWQREHQESAGRVNDIYYAVRDSYGGEIAGQTRLTNDTPGDSAYHAPNLAQIWSARLILTWASYASGNDDIYYAVINSSGAIVKPATDLSVDETVLDWRNYDVAQLSNGRILVAWEARGCFADEWAPRIRFAILDSSYNRVVAPTCLGRHAAATSGDTAVSVAADRPIWSPGSGLAILTWMDSDWSRRHNLYYALVNSNGSVLTPPMIFRRAGISPWGDQYIFTSGEGYGNTSFSWFDILACRTHLPLTLRDFISYFEGPWEQEPNNSYLEANGPLYSGRDYYGYPNDQKDYFSIYLRTGGTITIDLTNHTGQGVQLQLFYQSVSTPPVAYDLSAPYHITYNGAAGWYYIYVYTAGGYNQSTPYTLRVTYP